METISTNHEGRKNQSIQLLKNNNLVQSHPYQTEIEAIKRKYGGLEAMRNKLGFSRRKVCEALLVDPSAWSRWVKPKQNSDTLYLSQESAPAHVYKTLSLLIALREMAFSEQNQNPPMLEATKFDSHQLAYEAAQIAQVEADKKLHGLQMQIDAVKNQDVQKQELTLGWKFLLLINTFLLLYFILF